MNSRSAGEVLAKMSAPIASARVAAPPATELDITALHRQHAPFIARTILRLLGDGDHVDDLLQETFLLAYRKRASYDAARGPIEAWLYGIAANLCRRHRRGFLRRTRAYAQAAELASPAVRSEGETRLIQRELAQSVAAALADVPFKQREVFILYELEERTGQDIAAFLGVPLGTVWTRLAKARERFQAKLRHLARKEAA